MDAHPMDAPVLCSSGGWRDSDLFLLAGVQHVAATLTVEFENVSAFGESIKIKYSLTGYDQ